LFDRESSFFQETVSLIDKNQEQKEYVHDKIRNVLKERKELQKKLGELNNSISGFRGNISFLEAKSTNVITDFTAIEKKTFIKMCGIKDCKGYINHKGTCALCKNVICMQCHEDKIQGHECKPENIESVNKIFIIFVFIIFVIVMKHVCKLKRCGLTSSIPTNKRRRFYYNFGV
jgi:chromosome segregation ATPase